MEKIFPKILKESIKGRNHESARRFLDFLSRKDLKTITYRRLIDYRTGEIDFEKINNTFKIKSLEISIEGKEFIVLTIAKGLEESWKKAYMESNKFVKEHINKLDDSLRSIESDEEVLSELRKMTEDILYEVHLRALGGE